jgi:hypothetical protein
MKPAKTKAKVAKAKSPAKAKAAKKAKVTKAKSPAKNGAAKSTRGVKMQYIHALLVRKSGCTSKEVLAATGWTAVSMPAMAKACGLKLRKEKEQGSVTRYFGE